MKRRLNLFLMVAILVMATAAAPVYRTPKGSRYHTRRECIALRTSATVSTITLAEATAAHLTLCGICARAKK